MTPPGEALRRAIERGRDRDHLGALYSGPSIQGPRRASLEASGFTSSAQAAPLLGQLAELEIRGLSAAVHHFDARRHPGERGGWRKNARR